MNDNKHALAIVSLVLGIVSLVLAWFGYFVFLGLAASIVGLVLAVMARKQDPSGIATGGLVTSIIGVCLNGLIAVSCVACAGGLTCIGLATA